jgi:hypothetical protein
MDLSMHKGLLAPNPMFGFCCGVGLGISPESVLASADKPRTPAVGSWVFQDPDHAITVYYG